MVIPSWAPSPTPEAPEAPVFDKTAQTQTRRKVFGATLVVGVLGAAAALYILVAYPVEPTPPQVAVDLLLEDLANQRWEPAAQRFGSQCSDVSPEILRLQFEPIMMTYDDHAVLPVSNLDPGDDGFVRVLGTMETASGDTNSVRADVAESVDSEGNVRWSVCGVQIYGP